MAPKKSEACANCPNRVERLRHDPLETGDSIVYFDNNPQSIHYVRRLGANALDRRDFNSEDLPELQAALIACERPLKEEYERTDIFAKGMNRLTGRVAMDAHVYCGALTAMCGDDTQAMQRYIESRQA